MTLFNIILLVLRIWLMYRLLRKLIAVLLFNSLNKEQRAKLHDFKIFLKRCKEGIRYDVDDAQYLTTIVIPNRMTLIESFVAIQKESEALGLTTKKLRLLLESYGTVKDQIDFFLEIIALHTRKGDVV